MMAIPDPIETAIVQGACRVLTRRAEALRSRAALRVTIIQDSAGRPVRILEPEACVALGTADLWDEIAADLRGGSA